MSPLVAMMLTRDQNNGAENGTKKWNLKLTCCKNIKVNNP